MKPNSRTFEGACPACADRVVMGMQPKPEGSDDLVNWWEGACVHGHLVVLHAYKREKPLPVGSDVAGEGDSSAESNGGPGAEGRISRLNRATRRRLAKKRGRR